MGEELTFEYQQDADILVIAQCPSYIGQDEDEIDDLVCARTNLSTGEIEYIEIVFFESRLKRAGEAVLPVEAKFSVAGSGAPVESARNYTSGGSLILKYDQPTDSLNLYKARPYPEQRSCLITNDLYAGMDPVTGDIESLAICSFKARMEKDGEIVLPIRATFFPAKSAITAD